MSDTPEANQSEAEGQIQRRQFLKYSSGVSGVGLGSTSTVAEMKNENETQPDGEILLGGENTGLISTQAESSVPTFGPMEFLSQTFTITLNCPRRRCRSRSFTITVIVEVEDTDSEQAISVGSQTWQQGYETEERTLELGTPNEWAGELGLDSPNGRWILRGKLFINGRLEDVSSTDIAVEEENDLSELITQKNDLISSIRSDVDQFPASERVDVAPNQFIGDVEEKIDNNELTTDEESQYTEALNRLVASEKVVKQASDRPVTEIVEESGNAIANTALSISVEVLTLGAGGGVSGQSVRLIGEQIAGAARSALRTFKGQFGEFATRVDNLITNSLVDFGRRVDEYVENHKRELRETDGFIDAKEGILRDALIEESLPGIVNAAKAANKLIDPDLLTDLQEGIQSLKSQFNQLAFEYYWFGDEVDDYSFNIPDPDLPEEFEFTVDMPFIESPFINDDITFSYSWDDDDAEQEISKFTDQLSRYADLVENNLEDVPGIEPTLTDSVALLEGEIDDFQLEEQDSESRNELVEIGQNATSGMTSATSTTFGAIKLLTNGILLLNITIGVVLLILYADLAILSTSSGVGAPAVVFETGLLLTLLAILGVVDVFLAVSKVAAIEKSLSIIAQIPTRATTAITTGSFIEVN